MINSYSDIKSIIEELYESNTPQGFVNICRRTLSGRGFDRLKLVRAALDESFEGVHNILEPLVNNLIRKNISLAKQQEDQYAMITLGNNEYRLRKVENKDKYKRAPGDYIVDINNGTCTCPEFITRLQEFTIPCKHQYMTEDKMEITQMNSKESALIIKEAKKIYADFIDDLLEREFYNWGDFIVSAKKGEVFFLEDGRYIFKDAPEAGFKSTSTSLIEDLKEKGVPIYPVDKDKEIMQEVSAVASLVKRLVTLADNFDNKGLLIEADIVDQIINVAGKARGIPDGTGPYGQGKGPGKGRGDGTGIKDKQKRRKRQVALLGLTQSKSCPLMKRKKNRPKK